MDMDRGDRRSIRSVLVEDMRKTSAGEVMFILIESGLLYVVFFVSVLAKLNHTSSSMLADG